MSSPHNGSPGSSLTHLLRLARRAGVDVGEYDGRDASHAVRLTLGADLFPRAIRVRTNWASLLSPDALGPAVLAAFTQAFVSCVNDLTARIGPERLAALTRETLAEDVAARRPVRGTGRVPDLRAVIEELWSIHEAPAEDARPPTGTGGRGGLTVTVSPDGLSGCVVDARWARGRTAAALMSAFAEALGEARRDLAAAQAPLVRSRAWEIYTEAMSSIPGEEPR